MDVFGEVFFVGISNLSTTITNRYATLFIKSRIMLRPYVYWLQASINYRSLLVSQGMTNLYPHTPTNLRELPPTLARLRDHVFQYSVKTGDFTLKSGKKSTWFLDTKQTMCRPDGMLLVAEAALEIIPSDVTAIGGLTMGADPVAFGIAAIAATQGRNLRSFSVRKEAKDHGVTGRIAGALQPGDKVVVTEDTVTRGTSPLEAVEVIRAFGADPVLITVIVDRGGTCGAMAQEAGLAFQPLLTAEDLGFDFGS